MIYAYANPKKSGSVEMCEAFVAGAQAAGRKAEVVTDGELRAPGEAAFYGVQKELMDCWRRVAKLSLPYWYIDNGYFWSKWAGGDCYRITKNRLQHNGLGESDGKRFSMLNLEILPWRRGGTHVLIAQQSPWWYEWQGGSIKEWTDHAEDIVRDWPAVIRGKPTTKTLPPIDWAKIKCVLTHSSNVAIDGLLQGVPCLVTSEYAAARTLAGCVETRTLNFPDNRREVFNVLADNQWTLEEIRKGVMWRTVKP